MQIAHATMLITGASQGIGRYLAVYFAEKGANVVLTARHDANLRETAALAETAAGRPCRYYVSDLRRRESLVALAGELERHADGVDILINNAADVTSKPLLDTSLDEIEHIIAANVTGCLELCRLIAPMMAARGRGMIINISSLAGYKPNPAQTVYSVSKAAVNSISEALRAELGPQGIHVMNVALASVGVAEPLRPGQVPVARFAARLERAILRDETEVFLSPMTKWLMRLYRFWPALARLR